MFQGLNLKYFLVHIQSVKSLSCLGVCVPSFEYEFPEGLFSVCEVSDFFGMCVPRFAL